MKTIGFIQRYDNLEISLPFEDYFNYPKLGTILRWRIRKYLNKGYEINGFLTALEDENRNMKFMCNHTFFTDGEFIWPAYLVYFLKYYPKFGLDPLFIQHIMANNFKPKISTITPELEKLFDDELEKIIINPTT